MKFTHEKINAMIRLSRTRQKIKGAMEYARKNPRDRVAWDIVDELHAHASHTRDSFVYDMRIPAPHEDLCAEDDSYKYPACRLYDV